MLRKYIILDFQLTRPGIVIHMKLNCIKNNVIIETVIKDPM